MQKTNTESASESDATKAFRYQLSQYDPKNPLQSETIRHLYRFIVSELSRKQRSTLIHQIVEEMREGAYPSSVLLLLFDLENDANLVYQLVEAYLKAAVTGPQQLNKIANLLPFLQKEGLRSRGVIHAALVSFGDRRVTAILRAQRKSHSATDARVFANAMQQQPIHQSTLEYCFGWLLDLIRRNVTTTIEPVCLAIEQQIAGRADELIHDRIFNFGHYGFESFGINNVQPVRDFVSRLEPILQVLEQHEHEALKQLVRTLRDLENTTQQELERRRVSSRRANERRGGDRRVVNIIPHRERRSNQRRSESERRVSTRR